MEWIDSIGHGDNYQFNQQLQIVKSKLDDAENQNSQNMNRFVELEKSNKSQNLTKEFSYSHADLELIENYKRMKAR